MRIVLQSSVDGILGNIKDSVNMCKSKDEVIKDIDFYSERIRDISWEDPDYFFDRKAQIVKKVNGEYISKDNLEN